MYNELEDNLTVKDYVNIILGKDVVGFSPADFLRTGFWFLIVPMALLMIWVMWPQLMGE